MKGNNRSRLAKFRQVSQLSLVIIILGISKAGKILRTYRPPGGQKVTCGFTIII